MGRGGRVLLDRVSTNYDDIWSKLDFKIYDNEKVIEKSDQDETVVHENCINPNSLAINTTSLDSSSSSRSLKAQNNHFNNNIVIKSENNSKPAEISDDHVNRVSQRAEKNESMNQNLDDFEQLLDSANASSNIINKNLVCKKSNDINNDGFQVKTIANSLSSSEIFSKDVSVLNSCNSDTIINCISSTNSSTATSSVVGSQKLEFDLPATTDSISSQQQNQQHGIEDTDMSDHKSDDAYKSFLEEIKSEWLHFQPLSPPLSPSMDNFVFDSDLLNDTKKFNVELQLLNYSDNETEITNCIDNTYLTQPMTFDCHNNSLEVLNSNMNECIPTDTVNIKTEPADRDFDSIMESTSARDTSESQVLGGESERISCSIMLNDIDYPEPFLSSSSIGCSNFKLINEKSFIERVENNLNLPVDAVNSNINVKSEPDFTNQIIGNNSSAPSIAVIKEAPIAELQSHNYVLQYGSPVATSSSGVNQSDSCNNNSSNVKYVSSGFNSTIANSANLIPQQFVNTGNAIISSASPSQQQNKMQSIVYDNNTFLLATTAPRKQLNGPADRNCE
jgi:hypothetical protein